jgi:hypothetical protein
MYLQTPAAHCKLSDQRDEISIDAGSVADGVSAPRPALPPLRLGGRVGQLHFEIGPAFWVPDSGPIQQHVLPIFQTLAPHHPTDPLPKFLGRRNALGSPYGLRHL